MSGYLSLISSFSSHYGFIYFRTTVRNGYNTVRLDKMYVDLRILTYIKKWDVPCLVGLLLLCETIKSYSFNTQSKKGALVNVVVLLMCKKLYNNSPLLKSSMWGFWCYVKETHVV